jgi:hypothetical protein
VAIVVVVMVASALGLSTRAPGTPLDVLKWARVVLRGWGASQGLWVPMLPLVMWHLVGPMAWRDGAPLEPLASLWVCGGDIAGPDAVRRITEGVGQGVVDGAAVQHRAVWLEFAQHHLLGHY